MLVSRALVSWQILWQEDGVEKCSFLGIYCYLDISPTAENFTVFLLNHNKQQGQNGGEESWIAVWLFSIKYSCICNISLHNNRTFLLSFLVSVRNIVTILTPLKWIGDFELLHSSLLNRTGWICKFICESKSTQNPLISLYLEGVWLDY